MALKKQVILEHCKFSGDDFGWVSGGKKNKIIENQRKRIDCAKSTLFFFYRYIQFMEHKGKKCLICPCGYPLESIVYSRVDF